MKLRLACTNVQQEKQGTHHGPLEYTWKHWSFVSRLALQQDSLVSSCQEDLNPLLEAAVYSSMSELVQ